MHQISGLTVSECLPSCSFTTIPKYLDDHFSGCDVFRRLLPTCKEDLMRYGYFSKIRDPNREGYLLS